MNSSTTGSDVLQSCFTNSLAEKVVKSIAYSLIALVGLLGNSLICFIFWKRKNLRRTINYFIFNMAVSDLLVPIFAIPRRIKEVFITIPRRWFVSGAPGTLLCMFSYFAQDVSFVVSIMSLLFMAFERFVAVVFPMRVSSIIGNTRSRMVLIALTWIAAIAVHASYFYTFRLVKNENNITLCTSSWEPALDHKSTQRRYGITTFVLFVIVPFGLLVLFYTSIAIAIRKQNNSLGNSTEGIPERLRREKENRAVTILSAVVVGGFVLCCAPMNTYVFVQIFGFNVLKTIPNCDYWTFYFVADFLVRASTVVNPCTCFVFYRSYRQSLGEMFQSLFQVFSKPCRSRPAENLPAPSPLQLRQIRVERKRTIHRL